MNIEQMQQRQLEIDRAENIRRQLRTSDLYAECYQPRRRYSWWQAALALLMIVVIVSVVFGNAANYRQANRRTHETHTK